MKTSRPAILGPNGKAARPQVGATYLTPSPRFNWKQYKPRYYLSQDTKVNINPYDRWECVNYSRQLFAQIPEVGGAIRQKNQYAFGDSWDAHYEGKCTDPAWIEAAEEYLNEVFFPNANIRGGPFSDFNHSLKVSGYAMDYDGDDVMLFTEDEQHNPRVLFVTAPHISSQSTAFGYGGITVKERFKTPDSTDGEIKGGPFDGAKIFDGIIMDRNSRVIGVRVMGDEDYSDFSLFQADLRCDNEWHDQGRGLPMLARPMLRWMNWQDTQEFLERAVKRVAAQPITAKTKSGDAVMSGLNPIEESAGSSQDPTTETLVSGTQTAPGSPNQLLVRTEIIEGGEVLYLSTDDKEELTGINFQVPHENVAQFLRETVRGGLLAIGWFLELVNLGDTGRASTRMLCRLGNQSIWSRRTTMYPRWKRAMSYAIAKAMKHGALPKNDVDPFAFEPGYPEDLSVDEGNDDQASRENLKMGMTSKAIEAQKRGHHWKRVQRHRVGELKALIDDAHEVVKYSNGAVEFEAAMELLEQRAPNPVYQLPQDPGQQGKIAGATEELDEPPAKPKKR